MDANKKEMEIKENEGRRQKSGERGGEWLGRKDGRKDAGRRPAVREGGGKISGNLIEGREGEGYNPKLWREIWNMCGF